MASIQRLFDVIDTVSAYTLEKGDFVAVTDWQGVEYIGTITDVVDEGLVFDITLDKETVVSGVKWDELVHVLSLPA